MKNQAGSFSQTAPDKLELKKGGGCLGCFGIPFFLAGIFMFLAVLQIVPFSNAQEVPWWSWILLTFMAVVFTLVGGSLVFGRHWVVLDLNKNIIWKAWGWLRPMKGTIYDLGNYRTVILRLVPGDSDTSDSYQILLRARNETTELDLHSTNFYGSTLTEAKKISEFLRMPLIDLSSVNPLEIAPEGSSPSNPEAGDADMAKTNIAPPLPLNPSCKIEQEKDFLRISIPGAKFTPWWLLEVAIPFALILYFGRGIIGFFISSHTPPPVYFFFLSFFFIFFFVIPLTGILKKYGRSKGFLTSVLVDKKGIEITHIKKKVNLPWAKIVGFDCETAEDLRNRAMYESSISPSRYPGRRSSTQQPNIPGWLMRLNRYTKSKGIVVKTLDDVHYFGAGMADDELRYLFWLIQKYSKQREQT